MVSGSFHSPSGVLFTFPSRYWFTIGQLVVFSLTQWSAWIQTGLLVPRPTQDTVRRSIHFEYGGITLYAASSQKLLLYINFVTPKNSPTTPTNVGLGFSPFARRYLGNRILFLFLQVLRCFSSLGIPPHVLCIHTRVTTY
jgi:hypothetical protein